MEANTSLARERAGHSGNSLLFRFPPIKRVDLDRIQRQPRHEIQADARPPQSGVVVSPRRTFALAFIYRLSQGSRNSFVTEEGYCGLAASVPRRG
jgi:hypothetical protein